MKTSISTRLAGCAAALVITFTTVQAIAAYALQPAAEPILVSVHRVG